MAPRLHDLSWLAPNSDSFSRESCMRKRSRNKGSLSRHFIDMTYKCFRSIDLIGVWLANSVLDVTPRAISAALTFICVSPSGRIQEVCEITRVQQAAGPTSDMSGMSRQTQT